MKFAILLRVYFGQEQEVSNTGTVGMLDGWMAGWMDGWLVDRPTWDRPGQEAACDGGGGLQGVLGWR